MVMDMEVFERHSDVQIRNDFIDCQIDICSVEVWVISDIICLKISKEIKGYIYSLQVLALFTENFDYQDIRKDFLYGILTSDLLGKTIYCHIVKDAYAARVRDLQTYDAIR